MKKTLINLTLMAMTTLTAGSAMAYQQNQKLYGQNQQNQGQQSQYQGQHQGQQGQYQGQHQGQQGQYQGQHQGQQQGSQSYQMQQGVKKLVLQYDGQHLRGQNTLFLKRKIKQQYPMMKLFKKQLLKVKLVAKTKLGRGTATLKVGQGFSNSQIVDGTPRLFFRNGPRTYDRVFFQNPNAFDQSKGVWQIKLRGNFKIGKVVVFLKPIGLDTVELGSVTSFQRQITRTVLPVHQSGVKKLILTGLRKRTEILMVKVKFGNGNVREIYKLEGLLFPGDQISKEFFAPNGRTIKKIIIKSQAATRRPGMASSFKVSLKVK